MNNTNTQMYSQHFAVREDTWKPRRRSHAAGAAACFSASAARATMNGLTDAGGGGGEGDLFPPSVFSKQQKVFVNKNRLQTEGENKAIRRSALSVTTSQSAEDGMREGAQGIFPLCCAQVLTCLKQ